MNRVSVFKGSSPILLVAPHGGGPSDVRTAMMTDYMSQRLSCYAVINTGWIRRSKPNYKDSKANCNNINHCKKKPLKQEFLLPILWCKDKILQYHNKANLFMIHGMDDSIRDYGDIDVVVGFGQGNPPHISCTNTFKDRVLASLAMEGFTPAQGKAGGRLSAWDSKNLNQLFIDEPRVESIQIEVVLSLRNTDHIAKLTSHRLANAISRAVDRRIFLPALRKIREH